MSNTKTTIIDAMNAYFDAKAGKTPDSNTSTLPEVVKIKSTDEIKIGDTLVYTGKPRGTGMFVPEIGATWEMKDKGDIVAASIQIIERGRGWWPIKK